MPLIIGLLAVISGYLLGSIPSAYIIGRSKGIDLTLEDGDGRLGTSLAFRRLGKMAGSVVATMDFSKGVMTMVLAQVLGVPIILSLSAGLAAVAGHNWSLFLGFKGGRGSMVSYGILASLALWGFVIALALAGIVFLSTRRSTPATVALMAILPIILLAQDSFRFLPALPWEREITPLVVIFPLTLLIPNFLKYLQIQKLKTH